MSRRPSRLSARATARAGLLAVLSAGALVGPASAAVVTKTWNSTCTTMDSTRTSFAVTNTFSADVPTQLRPGAYLSFSNIQYTAALPAASVKALSPFGTEVQISGSRLYAVTDAKFSTGTVTVLPTSASSARRPIEVDQLNVFDGSKTTYKPLALAVSAPPVWFGPTVLATSGSGTSVVSLGAFSGAITFTQLFGQAVTGIQCTPAGGTFATIALGSFPPVVNSLSPNSGPEAGGNLVTVIGSALDSTTVTIGGVNAPVVERGSTRIVVQVPRGTGTQKLVVSGPPKVSTPVNYTYTRAAAPAITSISPGSAPELFGTRITLSGTALTPANAVTFNGTAVSFTQSGGQISFDAPGLAKGTYPIRVTTDGGTASGTFTFAPWF